MIKVLITAATGNVSSQVLKKLENYSDQVSVFAGIRNDSLAKFVSTNANIPYRIFDFGNSSTFNKAFEGIDILFLLLPPGLKDYKKVFEAIVNSAKKS
jgi:uncharacterized protein YbjT (DUF2867 family)